MVLTFPLREDTGILKLTKLTEKAASDAAVAAAAATQQRDDMPASARVREEAAAAAASKQRDEIASDAKERIANGLPWAVLELRCDADSFRGQCGCQMFPLVG